MSVSVVGTCSLCSGAVTVPSIWMGIYPPTPKCSACGAHPKNPHGPTIEMEPSHGQPTNTPLMSDYQKWRGK